MGYDRQRISFIQGAGSEGVLKYNGIRAGPDERLYCAPYNASKVLVIDPETRKLSFIEGVGEGGMKYYVYVRAPMGGCTVRH